MAVQTVQIDIGPLHHTLRAARQRLWWQMGILTCVRGLCLGLVAALIGALLSGWQAPDSVTAAFWLIAGAAPVAGLITALVVRPTVSSAARLADSRLGLQQQLGTAEELLVKGSTGGLASVQIARASVVAGEAPIHRAFPLIPKAEVAFALLLASATAILLVLTSLGIILPNPLTSIRLPSFSSDASTAGEWDPFGRRQPSNGLKSRSPALESVRQSLDALEKQSLKGALSPAAAAAAIAQANSELNRVAAESRIHQEALDSLARELQSTAAGRDAADSLRQGNYDKAAEQLREMGKQSDQLSAAAKQELAQALNRAAEQGKQDQGLSNAESKAASSLDRNDYSSTVKSMDDLARAMQDSANKVVPQQELASDWQRLQDVAKQFGNLQAQGGNIGPLAPPVAQAPQAPAERRSEGSAQGPGDQAASPESGDSEGGDQGGEPGGGSQPGNTRGRPPLGSPNQRLGSEGASQDVDSKIGDRFSDEPSSDSQAPSVLREGKGNSLPSEGTGQADGPISIPAEKVLVPGERRSTVRDYFNGGSGDR